MTEEGQLDGDGPRDRDSSFEPRLTMTDDNLYGLYAKGRTPREIVATFKEMYDADVSNPHIQGDKRRG